MEGNGEKYDKYYGYINERVDDLRGHINNLKERESDIEKDRLEIVMKIIEIEIIKSTLKYELQNIKAEMIDIENSTKMSILFEEDENGKPKYKNEAQRNVELYRRLSEHEKYEDLRKNYEYLKIKVEMLDNIAKTVRSYFYIDR